MNLSLFLIFLSYIEGHLRG